MTVAAITAPSLRVQETVADLLKRLGDISPSRVLAEPPPGTAVETQVVELHDKHNRLFELVDGTLVEKAMGYRESILAGYIVAALTIFNPDRKFGLVTGADGMLRLFAGLVRIPDVAFITWARLPGGRVPREPIPQLAPELVVEILSPSNSRAEMSRKRNEYFSAGVQLVWEIDPDARTATTYTSVRDFAVFNHNQTLTGDPVLPGFQLSLADLFAQLDDPPSEPA
jgi:Uma2 family endonuclease